MAEKKNDNKDNVVQLSNEKCIAEGCKDRSHRAGFCNTHYAWFKEGLLTAEGYHAKDFDKKHALYMNRQANKKAA